MMLSPRDESCNQIANNQEDCSGVTIDAGKAKSIIEHGKLIPNSNINCDNP